MLELISHMHDQGFIHCSHLLQSMAISEVDAIVLAIHDHASAPRNAEDDPSVISRLLKTGLPTLSVGHDPLCNIDHE